MTINPCPNCRTVNPASNSFCVSCGANLNLTKPGNGITSSTIPRARSRFFSDKGFITGLIAGVGTLLILMVGLGLFFGNNLLEGKNNTDSTSKAGIDISNTPTLETTTKPSEVATTSVKNDLPTPVAINTTAPPTTILTPTPKVKTPTISPTNTPLPAVESPTPQITLVPAATITAVSTKAEEIKDAGNDNKDKIAFCQEDESSHWSLYTIKADGSELRKVISHPEGDIVSPAFSPDGVWIAYSLQLDNNHFQLRKVRFDGSNDVALTGNTERNDSPAWSPDGKQIFFVSNRNKPNQYWSTDLYMVNSEGGNPTLVVAGGQYASINNGLLSYIIFNGTSHDLLTQTYPSGNNKKVLAGNGAEYFYNSTSPDGSKIAVTKGLDNNRAIYLVNLDGSQRRISPEGETATYPTWAPDGNYLAYLVLTGNIWELNLVNINTGQSQRLLTTGKKKFYIAWGR